MSQKEKNPSGGNSGITEKVKSTKTDLSTSKIRKEKQTT